MKYEIPDELVYRILRDAKRQIKCREDGFCAVDWSGSNVDDAWDGGFNDGEISLSQDLAEHLSKPVE